MTMAGEIRGFSSCHEALTRTRSRGRCNHDRVTCNGRSIVGDSVVEAMLDVTPTSCLVQGESFGGIFLS